MKPELTVPRRAMLSAAAALAMAAAVPALAQPYPSKPIRIVLGYGAGGGMDNLARLYGPKLSEILGQPIVIENKPGAGEIVAAQAVMNAPADGYTLWLAAASALVQGPAVRTDLPYTIEKNFVPVSLIGEAQGIVIVRNQIPINNLKELVAYAKASPGKLNYGTSGIGSGNHLATELFMAQTGAAMTHIPYKSAIENMQAAMAGNVDYAIDIAQTVIPLATEGKLKAIAVTGANRMHALPNVPTIAETGVPGLINNTDPFTFYGLMAPAGTPPQVVQRINEAVNKVASMPDVVEKMRNVFTLQPYVGTSASYGQFLLKESTKWKLLSGKVKVGN